MSKITISDSEHIITKRYTVEGTSRGSNGIDYGQWIRIVDAENEQDAKAKAVCIIRRQCQERASVCKVTSVEEFSESTEWSLPGSP